MREEDGRMDGLAWFFKVTVMMASAASSSRRRELRANWLGGGSPQFKAMATDGRYIVTIG
jgi:hypothetical protein